MDHTDDEDDESDEEELESNVGQEESLENDQEESLENDQEDRGGEEQVVVETPVDILVVKFGWCSIFLAIFISIWYIFCLQWRQLQLEEVSNSVSLSSGGKPLSDVDHWLALFRLSCFT